VDGHRAEILGLNLVGLKRAGFDQERRSAIKRAYRLLYKSGLKPSDALGRLQAQEPNEDVVQIIHFVESSKRGLVSHR
jgi:UDP-N-acetylglucosamine acyltransferase